jgi:hypothetical protein
MLLYSTTLSAHQLLFFTRKCVKKTFFFFCEYLLICRPEPYVLQKDGSFGQSSHVELNQSWHLGDVVGQKSENISETSAMIPVYRPLTVLS